MNTEQHIAEQVAPPLNPARTAIQGGNSKAFYGYPAPGNRWMSRTQRHCRIRSGRTGLTCRAGSRCPRSAEPCRKTGSIFRSNPRLRRHATVGGTVACGFSGPRRPWQGSLRDYLLGVKMVNGSGEVVQFGGQVMKNVAGLRHVATHGRLDGHTGCPAGSFVQSAASTGAGTDPGL